MAAYSDLQGLTLYVCNRTGVINGDGLTRARPVPSVANAVALVATDTGLVTQATNCVVMQGHAENITASNVFSGSATNTGAMVFPAGFRIIGEGKGSNRPTFTLTATASAISWVAAGCTLENCILLSPASGSVSVTVGIAIAADGCEVRDCLYRLSAASGAKVLLPIRLTSAAANAKIVNLTAYSVTGTSTSVISTTGTIGAINVEISGCKIQAALVATTGGVIDVSSCSGTAPANWVINNNPILSNETASSTVAIKGVSGWTGVIDNTLLGIQTTGAGSAISTAGNLYIGANCSGAYIGHYGIPVGTIST